MTSELSVFAARLREFIETVSRVAPTSNGSGAQHAEAWTTNRAGDVPFNALALELFALQCRHNAPYRRCCEARGATPKTVCQWREIPAIPTEAFKELELTCLPPTERTAVFHSSGTTGRRTSRHFHSAESLTVYEASLKPWFRAHVVADSQWPMADGRWMILTPSSAPAPHSSLVHMFETIRREFRQPDSVFVGRLAADGAWGLDLPAVPEALREADRHKRPMILLGTAFSFVHLLDVLAERDLRFQLPLGSRVMETGGYKGRSRILPKAELHARLTEYLGVPSTRIVCEYGMSELSSQAYDLRIQNPESRIQNLERPFHFPPWARVRIISPETGCEVADGETGLIRVLDLANVFSVMAIQTEDLGIRRGGGFELVGRAVQTEPRGCSLMAV